MDAIWDRLAASNEGRHGSVLFAEDFGRPQRDPDPAPEPEVIAPSVSDAALTAARAEAWADGYAAGRGEAEAETGRALAQASEALGNALASADAAARAVAEEAAEALGALIVDALGVLLPELCARHGGDEALALARALLPGLAVQPAVHVAAAPEIIPRLQQEVLRRLPEAQRGRIRVQADGDLAPGDLLVNWEAGSARRDFATVWQQVRDVLGASGLVAAEESRELVDAG